jgi:hypothetical protein
MNINAVFQASSARADNYIQAVQNKPDVRRLELSQLLERTTLHLDDIILDVPSLGNNFWSVIKNKPVRVISCDYEPQTAYKTNVIHEGVYRWKVPKGHHLVSAASLHHISDLNTFLSAARYNLLPNATIHIADVDPNSAISRFLDAGVHSPEQAGIYRTFSDVPGVTFNEVLPCPWLFKTKIEAVLYCKSLFNFENLTTDEVFEKLDAYGLIKVADNFVTIDWKLRYVDIQVKPKTNFSNFTDS